MVKKVAIEMAGVTYERWASKHPQFYIVHPDQKKWIEDNWQSFIEMAREQLAKMLQQGGLAATIKDEIADALIKDNSIRFGQTTGIQVKEW
jgi:hypothetical protein